MIKQTVLMILDGFGINEQEDGNAVKQANIPNIDKLLTENPSTIIRTSGSAVGLPEGQIGSSEAGHVNIGAGRIVEQDLTMITRDVENGNFFGISEFVKAIENAKEKNTNVHLMGLVSDGGIHSHSRHLYALLELAKRKDFERVYIHCFMDGRDSSPASGESFIAELEDKIKEKGVGKIASISGRYYAMDRGENWDRIKKVYEAMVNGEGEKALSATSAVEESYQKEVFDEFIEPTVITNKQGKPVATIQDGDSVIFFNFRSDRAKELTRALADRRFDKFQTKRLYTYFVSMTCYDKKLSNIHVAYKKERISNGFGEYLSSKGFRQLRITEKDSSSHVTTYFNCGNEEQYRGEDRIIVPSVDVLTNDLKPEMSAEKITEKAIEAIKSKKYDNIVINFSNPDMIGHLGNLDASIKSLEVLDEYVNNISEAVDSVGGVLLITSDHGNCEQIIDYTTGEPYTAHTANPVPLAIVGLPMSKKLREGNLSDLAPTMLEIMGLDKPEEMTGESLIEG